MPILAEKIFNKIELFNEQAEQLITSKLYLEAFKVYQKAWNELPEPKQLWDVGLWVKLGQAECSLALNDFESAKKKLLEAVLCAGAVSNPLVHLLLGICYFELGDLSHAHNELQIAYDLEGETLFVEGDEKYRQFLFADNVNVDS
jgi:tetratricopeptide (TPR) repeat protein